MPLPTPTNPALLRFFNAVSRNQSIPALKNQREPIVTRSGQLRFVASADVQRFVKSMTKALTTQWQSQGFDLIRLPLRVAVLVEVYKYVTDPTVVPLADLDNQYTTIQEMLQGVALENDRQIVAFHAQEVKTLSRQHQIAYCYLWETAAGDFSEYMQFYQSRPNRLNQDAAAIPSLLSLMLSKGDFDG